MWNNPDESLPELAQRVVVETADGHMSFARRVLDPDNIQKARWLGDDSIPVRLPVVAWFLPVSPGATQ